jgi:hypothetical protein
MSINKASDQREKTKTERESRWLRRGRNGHE